MPQWPESTFFEFFFSNSMAVGKESDENQFHKTLNLAFEVIVQQLVFTYLILLHIISFLEHCEVGSKIASPKSNRAKFNLQEHQGS